MVCYYVYYVIYVEEEKNDIIYVFVIFFKIKKLEYCLISVMMKVI